MKISVIPFCLLALFALPTLAQQAPRHNVVLIVDGSGSMWGRVEGNKQKIQVVRSAITSVVVDLAKQKLGPANLELGLMAYGHRKKADCRDVQSILPIAPVKSSVFSKRVRQIKPAGKTPITTALELAFASLKDRPGRRSIVLVSDGFENCRRDPCTLAQSLQKSAPRLGIHVLALGKNAKEIKKLRCVSQPSGGQFTWARKANQLAPALSAIFKTLADDLPVASIAKPVAKPVIRQTPGLKLAARLVRGGPIVSEGVSWSVKQEGRELSIQQKMADGRTVLDYAPGQYEVSATYGMASAARTIDVKDKGVTELTLVLNAGSLRMRAVPQAGKAPLDDAEFIITKAGEGADEQNGFTDFRMSGREPVARLPAGRYAIVVRHGLSTVRRSIDLKAGETRDLSLVLQAGTLKLAARAIPEGDFIEDVFYTVLRKNTEDGTFSEEVARTAAHRPRLKLPEGDYLVVAEHGLVRVRQKVTVKTEVDDETVITLNAGVLRLRSVLAESGTELKKHLSYQVFARKGGDTNGTDEMGQEIARTTRPNAVLTLAAGDYYVVGRLGRLNVTTTKQVQIRAGGDEAVTLEHQAGEVSLALVAQPGSVAFPRVFWRLLDGRGQEIKRTSRAFPKFLLAQGQYKAIATKDGQTYERLFSVAIGDKKKVEIVAR